MASYSIVTMSWVTSHNSSQKYQSEQTASCQQQQSKDTTKWIPAHDTAHFILQKDYQGRLNQAKGPKPAVCCQIVVAYRPTCHQHFEIQGPHQTTPPHYHGACLTRMADIRVNCPRKCCIGPYSTHPQRSCCCVGSLACL